MWSWPWFCKFLYCSLLWRLLEGCPSAMISYGYDISCCCSCPKCKSFLHVLVIPLILVCLVGDFLVPAVIYPRSWVSLFLSDECSDDHQSSRILQTYNYRVCCLCWVPGQYILDILTFFKKFNSRLYDFGQLNL